MSWSDGLFITDIVQRMCNYSVTKYFSARLDVQNTLGMYSMWSRRGPFRSLHFSPHEPRWIFPDSSQPYTPCCIFLSTLPPSVHTGEAKSQTAMTPFPTAPTHASLPSSSDHLSGHNLIPPWITTELIHSVYCPLVIAKVLATAGLAIKSNSIRSQIANGNIVKDAWLRQQRIMGTQELQGRCPT